MALSPIHRSFNAGEFSAFMDGRTDIDRYPASMKVCKNYVSVAQGPLVPRSGTMIVTPIADEAKGACLRAFIFSNNQAFNLEFGDNELRFVSASGLLAYDPSPITAVGDVGGFLQITSATLDASVGEQASLAGFPADKSPRKAVARITAKSGDNYTLDVPFPPGLTFTGAPTASRVYRVATPYSFADVDELSGTQKHDTVYLFCRGYRTHKLVRKSAYDWELTEVEYIDGPFMRPVEGGTLLTPSTTGRATLLGGTASQTGFGSNQWSDEDLDTVAKTASGSAAEGAMTWDFGATTPGAQVIVGYKMHIASKGQQADFTPKDNAPTTWRFQASNDNAAWVTLDARKDFVLYVNGQTPWFEINNTASYRYYRIDVDSNVNGTGRAVVAVAQVDYRVRTPPVITLTASSANGINGDLGFLATDVGRLLRVRDRTGCWHSLKIASRVSATVITASLQDAPLPSTDAIREWRMGYFSDTTGWPTRGLFYNNRLWLTGAEGFPNIVVASIPYAYETFSPTDQVDGVVADDSSMALDVDMERLSAANWISSDDRAVLFGTADGEFAIKAQVTTSKMGALNVEARLQTSRGSNDAGCVRVDRQILFPQRHGRTLREMAFVYEADGYKCPSMSMFAGHMGESRFVELVHAAEPHSLVWVRREDGSLISLAYNRDENVIGWHRHDLAGGKVESLSVLPSENGTDDILWLIVRRTVNGETRRYIEYLSPFWTFGMTVADACFVDCAARYNGAATSVIHGLWHLEAQSVVGLVKVAGEWQVLPAVTVANGAISVPAGTTEAVVGLGYEGFGQTNRLDVNTPEGTSQGKIKRIHKMVLRVWQSAGGKIGRSEDELERVAYSDPPSLPDTVLRDTDCVLEWPNGYDRDAYVCVKREADFPLPLTITAMMPEM